LRLVALDSDGIWTEVENPAYSPVLRRPNRYQNRIQFIESWVLSKLIHGNTYVLKQRDARNVVTALYILDPTRTRPLVAPDGAVFYALKKDNLSQLDDDVIVPASEIIHDRMNCFFHPLVGISPIYACGLAALQGIKIQNNSTLFFANGSQPGGVLTAPGAISQETANRVKDKWETEFGGASNFGKVAVLGDGLKYEPMMMKFIDAQLIDQLKWTGENVCTCFRVPAYMVGIGPPPNYNNIEALNAQYYAQGLQYLIEGIELNLDEGLELKKPFGTEFDLDDLLRMDSATMMSTIKEGVGSAVMTPKVAIRLTCNSRTTRLPRWTVAIRPCLRLTPARMRPRRHPRRRWLLRRWRIRCGVWKRISWSRPTKCGTRWPHDARSRTLRRPDCQSH
jgi:HK97 family phage portal protein